VSKPSRYQPRRRAPLWSIGPRNIRRVNIDGAFTVLDRRPVSFLQECRARNDDTGCAVSHYDVARSRNKRRATELSHISPQSPIPTIALS
jgi:hypothetical protein